MRKIPAAAAEPEEGQELRRRRRRQRRQKLPAWCSECGRGGPGARGAAAGKGLWEGVWGRGSGVSGGSPRFVRRSGQDTCSSGSGTPGQRGAPGPRALGTPKGRPARDQSATCLACSTDPLREPPRSGDSHSLQFSRALPSPLVTPSSSSSPLLSLVVPTLQQTFPTSCSLNSFPPVSCPSTLFPSVLCRVRVF